MRENDGERAHGFLFFSEKKARGTRFIVSAHAGRLHNGLSAPATPVASIRRGLTAVRAACWLKGLPPSSASLRTKP